MLVGCWISGLGGRVAVHRVGLRPGPKGSSFLEGGCLDNGKGMLRLWRIWSLRGASATLSLTSRFWSRHFDKLSAALRSTDILEAADGQRRVKICENQYSSTTTRLRRSRTCITPGVSPGIAQRPRQLPH